MQTPPEERGPPSRRTSGGTPKGPPIASGWIALRARAAAANDDRFDPHTPSAPHRGGSDSDDSAS
ncbi:MAG: hypothetical protein QGF72_05650 [Candidatus Poseidoniaceae archaeon]|nr:hypothetical protein [Candidatus Poseidoniaceae archaeon]